MNVKLYALLLIVTVLAAVGGVLTLVPAAAASWENVLGYKSLCTFVPAATLYCFFIAGAACVLRASLVKRRTEEGKPSFRTVPVVVLSIVFTLAVASTVWVETVNARYTDAVTGATQTE